LILEALSRGITGIGDAIEEALTAEKAISPEDAFNRAERSVGKHVKVDPTALANTVKNLYGDAALRSTKYAIKQMGGAGVGANLDRLVAGVKWDNWKPGSDAVALSQYPSVLKDLLDSSYLLAEGVSDTTKKRVAQQIADGIRAGSNYQTVSRNINAVINDPLRAEVIAITETNRAFNRASIIAYTSGGAKKWEWIAYGGACDKCASKAGIDFDVNDPIPPLHPDCRCGVTPVLAGAGNLDLGGNIPPTNVVPPVNVVPPTPKPPVTPPVPRHPINAEAVVNTTSQQTLEPFTLPEYTKSNIVFADHVEAKQWLADRKINYVGNDAENYDLRFFNDFASAVTDVETQYGVPISDYIQEFGFAAAPRSNWNAWAGYTDTGLEESRFGATYKTTKVMFNRDKARNYDAFDARNMQDAKTRYTVSNGIYGIVRHELGHTLQWTTTIDGIERPLPWKLTTKSKLNPISVGMREAGYRDGRGLKKDLIAQDLSRYGATNEFEFHAEASALFSDPARFNALPEESRKRLLHFQSVMNKQNQKNNGPHAVLLKEEDATQPTSDNQDWSDCILDDEGNIVLIGFVSE